MASTVFRHLQGCIFARKYGERIKQKLLKEDMVLKPLDDGDGFCVSGISSDSQQVFRFPLNV